MPGLTGVRIAGVMVAVLALAACASGPELTQAGLGESIREAARSSQAGRDYGAAVGYYRSLLQRNPDDLEAGLGLSRNLRFAGENGEALEVLRQLLTKKPNEPRLQLEQGKTMLGIGRPAEALEVLSKAQGGMADNWDVQTTLGVAYDRLGLAELARAAYQRALLLSPDNPTALNNYALSRAQAGELDGAVELLSRAAMQPAAGPAVRQNLALMHALKGDMERAERLVRQDLPADLARENIAYLRSLSGDTSRAGAAPRLPAAPPIAVTQQPAPVAAPPPPVVAAPSTIVVTPVPSVPKPAADSAQGAVQATQTRAPDAPTPLVEAPKPAAESAQGAVATAVVTPPPPPAPAPASTEAAPPSNEVLAQRIFGGGAPLAPYATPPSTPAPAPVAAAASGFVVQLGSYVDRPSGESALQRMQRSYGEMLAGAEVGLVEGNAGERAAWRVIARTAGEREGAVKLCDQLRAKGADCLVRRRLPGE